MQITQNLIQSKLGKYPSSNCLDEDPTSNYITILLRDKQINGQTDKETDKTVMKILPPWVISEIIHVVLEKLSK